MICLRAEIDGYLKIEMAVSPTFTDSPAPLLSVCVDGVEICVIGNDQAPCEVSPSVPVHPGSVVAFVASDGSEHTHALAPRGGWAHFSIRVHGNMGCQADCVISDSPQFDPDAVARVGALGIRFQPFFIPGSNMSNAGFKGKGLFARGLHFNGRVTPGNILLSCACDACHRSFLVRSFHAGFSQLAYFYSSSGKYTLTVSTDIAGAPVALADPDPDALAQMEVRLPKAPDGSPFTYLNPFRCPHCGAPYIDFIAHPGSRKDEYYGNYFAGSALLEYAPATG